MRKVGCFFSGEAGPASAATWAGTIGLVVTRAVVLIRLTRFRSTLCCAKPNHGFWTCQHLGVFFSAAAAAHPVGQRRVAKGNDGDGSGRQHPRRSDAKKKKRKNEWFFDMTSCIAESGTSSFVRPDASSGRRRRAKRHLKIFPPNGPVWGGAQARLRGSAQKKSAFSTAFAVVRRCIDILRPTSGDACRRPSRRWVGRVRHPVRTPPNHPTRSPPP